MSPAGASIHILKCLVSGLNENIFRISLFFQFHFSSDLKLSLSPSSLSHFLLQSTMASSAIPSSHPLPNRKARCWLWLLLYAPLLANRQSSRSACLALSSVYFFPYLDQQAFSSHLDMLPFPYIAPTSSSPFPQFPKRHSH